MHSDMYEDTILVEVEEDRSDHRGTVLIKYLAIFFLCPSKQFLLKSFQIQLVEYFSQNRRNKDICS
jgi:hypothetical protein